MGFALWLASGTLAFVAAWIAAFLLGLTATALDFGGWREPDPRAALACALAAFAIIGILRVATHRPSGEVPP
jgi:hypothetical protein